MKNVPRFECLTREEMKNTMARNEQGRSLVRKNIEMEYPWLMFKKGCEWMFHNSHKVITGMAIGLLALGLCLALMGIAI